MSKSDRFWEVIDLCAVHARCLIPLTVVCQLPADTVEERIMELQERKLKMLGAIIEQPDSELKAKGRSLTEADWRALLS